MEVLYPRCAGLDVHKDSVGGPTAPRSASPRARVKRSERTKDPAARRVAK
jgi:hypothetical protein